MKYSFWGGGKLPREVNSDYADERFYVAVSGEHEKSTRLDVEMNVSNEYQMEFN